MFYYFRELNDVFFISKCFITSCIGRPREHRKWKEMVKRRMIRTSASSFTYKITKLVGNINLPTLTNTSLTMPRGRLTDRSSSCKVIYIGSRSCKPNLRNSLYNITLMLTQESVKAFSTSESPNLHSTTSPPWYLIFCGNLFWRISKQFSLRPLSRPPLTCACY